MKILIIKPSSFGDIIQASPVVRALKEDLPEVQVTWLVFKNWEETVDLFPGLSGKIIWDRGLGFRGYLRAIREVRREKFDVVIDLQGLARTAVIARLSGARKIIGVPGLKELSWLLLKESFPESRGLNAVNRNLETVRYLTGKAHEPAFELRLSDGAEKAASLMLELNGVQSGDKVIAFIPKARGNSKTWPRQYYDELAGLILSKARFRIIALGAKGDGKGLLNPEITDLCGRTSIKTLAAVLARCSAVVGGDTGPVHLSSALGVPTVAVFGGSDVNETSPVSANAKVLARDLSCSPCRGRPTCDNYACLASIKPAEVYDALKAMLNL